MDYYLYQNNAAAGPFTLGQLRSMWHAGSITGETHFCPVGGEGWLKLKVIAGQLENDSQSTVRRPARLRAAVWMLALLIAGALAFVSYRLAHRTKPAAEAPVPVLLPKVPLSFEPRLSEFLREATMLSTLTGVGVTNAKYREQFIATTSAFEMLSAIWPENYSAEARQKFTQALEGWKLLLDFWQRRLVKDEQLRVQVRAQDEYYDEISRRDPSPYAKDHLRYEQQRLAARAQLSIPYAFEHDGDYVQILERFAPGRIVYCDPKGSKKFIRYDDNIQSLMAVAAQHFVAGRKLIEGSPLGR